MDSPKLFAAKRKATSMEEGELQARVAAADIQMAPRLVDAFLVPKRKRGTFFFVCVHASVHLFVRSFPVCFLLKETKLTNVSRQNFM
jgi:hypothetical protein